MHKLTIENISAKFQYLKSHLLDPNQWDEVIERLRDFPLAIRSEQINETLIHEKITPELRMEVTRIKRALNKIAELDTDVASGMWTHWPDFSDSSDSLAAHKALIKDCDELLEAPSERDYKKETGILVVETLSEICSEYTDVEMSHARRLVKENIFLRLVQDIGELCYQGDDLTERARNWIIAYEKLPE